MITYIVQPWPKGYKRYRARGACHRNAYRLASDHPEELVLVKGYALFGSVWIGHWWCADRRRRVLDPTWKNEGAAYVGLTEETVEEYAQRTACSPAWEVEVECIAPPKLVDALEAVALG